MKFIAFLIIIFSSVITATFSQSKSYKTLKNKFGQTEDVEAFAISGFLGRVVLRLTGEHDFRNAVKKVKHISFISIPKSAFKAERVSVQGFKKILKEDSFEKLLSVVDQGDDVSLYVQNGTKERHSRYFLLIEEESEVVAMEIRGYIDPNLMLKNSNLSYNQ